MRKDLIKHLIAGAAIAFITGIGAWLFDYHPAWGFMTSGLAGLGKEAWDQWIKQTGADPADITATWTGGFVTTMIMCGILLGLK